MKLLFLAPQPFFQERGTPIAVQLALQVLAARVGQGRGEIIDLLAYQEGEDVQIPGVTIHRINTPKFLNGVGPGISWKKLVCDLFFLVKALQLVWSARRNQYDLVHAVEESVFIAWLIKLIWKVPYIYDMDSSLAMQLTEKWWVLRPLFPIMEWFERLAVRSSIAVVPVCDALAAIANRHGSSETLVLRDISLLSESENSEVEDLRATVGMSVDEQLILYVGNLEPYQGIDLLLEGFGVAEKGGAQAALIVIGGSQQHIAYYAKKAQALQIKRAFFVGPRPISRLSEYILQADILASPRVRGNNTPMKIYSYLHSGRAIIATGLYTHTQLLTEEISLLVEPNVEKFGEGIKRLVADDALRQRIGKRARALAEELYTLPDFTRRLNELYDRLLGQIGAESTTNRRATAT